MEFKCTRFGDCCAVERSLAGFGSCYKTALRCWQLRGIAPLAAARLASALFVVRADWHRLHRRFNQTECNTQIVQPVFDFLFHGAPFRVVPSGENSVATSH